MLNDYGSIIDFLTIIGGLLGIILTITKIVGRLRSKPVSVHGKKFGDQYFAYFIFKEPLPLDSFTLDVFGGENLLEKVLPKKENRLMMKPYDEIILNINFEEKAQKYDGTLEVELLHGEKRKILGKTNIRRNVMDTTIVYEYLNKEVQLVIKGIFSNWVQKLISKIN